MGLQEKAKSLGIPFIETSAKNNDNVTTAFRQMATNIKSKFVDGDSL